MSRLATIAWFAKRPKFWPYMIELGRRRLRPYGDTLQDREGATRWAAEQAEPIPAVLSKLGISDAPLPKVPEDLLAEGRRLSSAATVAMGGAGDLDLLYAAARLGNAERIVETGVANGWSSLAFLAAIQDRPNGRLVSIDMPYPTMNNEAFVGVAVPSALRKQWTLVREPDRHGLRKGLALMGGPIDLCHYDSDKSYTGRQYGYPALWDALRPGGIFISDDIQDNFYFKEFVEDASLPFGVVECDDKFVGILRKP